MNNWFFEEPWLFLKGAVIFVIGSVDHQLSYLFIAMVIDLIFGVQVSVKRGNFKIKILIKKFGVKVITYGLWIAMFHAFDRITGLPDTGRWSLIVALVGLEIASSIKNTSKLGYGRLAAVLESLYLSLTKSKGGSTDEKSVTKKILELAARPKSQLKITIATLFSAIAIIAGFSRLSYVPLSGHHILDVTIVAVVFACLIGGYAVAIPLGLVWTLISYSNMRPLFLEDIPFWAHLVSKEVFVISLVYFYSLARRIFPQSPWNVYRAIIAGIVFYTILSMTFDAIYIKPDWLLKDIQKGILQVALSCVFMSLIIKHLRQIHILNGVRKKERKKADESE